MEFPTNYTYNQYYGSSTPYPEEQLQNRQNHSNSGFLQIPLPPQNPNNQPPQPPPNTNSQSNSQPAPQQPFHPQQQLFHNQPRHPVVIQPQQQMQHNNQVFTGQIPQKAPHFEREEWHTDNQDFPPFHQSNVPQNPTRPYIAPTMRPNYRPTHNKIVRAPFSKPRREPWSRGPASSHDDRNAGRSFSNYPPSIPTQPKKPRVGNTGFAVASTSNMVANNDADSDSSGQMRQDLTGWFVSTYGDELPLNVINKIHWFLLKLVIFDQSIDLCGFRQKDFTNRITRRLKTFILKVCGEHKYPISDQFALSYAEKCYEIHNKFSRMYGGFNLSVPKKDNSKEYCSDCNAFLHTVLPLLCNPCNSKVSTKMFSDITKKETITMADKSTYINR